jgi:hypothetical protein
MTKTGGVRKHQGRRLFRNTTKRSGSDGERAIVRDNSSDSDESSAVSQSSEDTEDVKGSERRRACSRCEDVVQRVKERPWFFLRQTIEVLLALALLLWLCWNYGNSHPNSKLRGVVDATLTAVDSCTRGVWTFVRGAHVPVETSETGSPA